jgi:hypothetical protein
VLHAVTCESRAASPTKLSRQRLRRRTCYLNNMVRQHTTPVRPLTHRLRSMKHGAHDRSCVACTHGRGRMSGALARTALFHLSCLSMSATTVMVCKRSSWHGLEPPAPSPLTVRLFHASRKQQFARAATLLELVSMADSTDRSSCTVLLGET